MQAAEVGGASRRDATRPVLETGLMKKRLLISGIVLAALLLALYGVIVGTGPK
jgi:hypothetical protein